MLYVPVSLYLLVQLAIELLGSELGGLAWNQRVHARGLLAGPPRRPNSRVPTSRFHISPILRCRSPRKPSDLEGHYVSIGK